VNNGLARNYFQDCLSNHRECRIKKGNYQQAIDQFWDAELIFIGNEFQSMLPDFITATAMLCATTAPTTTIDYFNRAQIISRKDMKSMPPCATEYCAVMSCRKNMMRPKRV